MNALCSMLEWKSRHNCWKLATVSYAVKASLAAWQIHTSQNLDIGLRQQSTLTHHHHNTINKRLISKTWWMKHQDKSLGRLWNGKYYHALLPQTTKRCRDSRLCKSNLPAGLMVSWINRKRHSMVCFWKWEVPTTATTTVLEYVRLMPSTRQTALQVYMSFVLLFEWGEQPIAISLVDSPWEMPYGKESEDKGKSPSTMYGKWFVFAFLLGLIHTRERRMWLYDLPVFDGRVQDLYIFGMDRLACHYRVY